jgi:beta-glucanase (GH16 family)
MILPIVILIIIINAIQLIAQDNSANQDGAYCDYVPVFTSADENLCIDGEYCLVFEDNFEGNTLNTSIWNFGPRIRYCNNEQQYYTSGQNIKVKNGILKLIAKEELIYGLADENLGTNDYINCGPAGPNNGINYRQFNFTSANIETYKSFSYGYYEARIKIPKGKGFWPAFWLYGNWPVYNEIDIFEFSSLLDGSYDPDNLSKTHLMTMHYDSFADGTKEYCQEDYTSIDFSQEFHTYGLLYEPNRIIWYVDDIPVRTDNKYYFTNGQEIGCNIYANGQYLRKPVFCKDPMIIILNLAIESGVAAPDNATIFPAELEVDWVRYYNKYECGGGIVVIGGNSPYFEFTKQYQSIIANNVIIESDNTLHSNEQLTIISKEETTILPDVNILEGSSFDVIIKEINCQYGNRTDNTYNKNNEIKFLNAYPNPAINELIIEGVQHSKIYIYSILGINILSYSIEQSTSLKLDISNLSSGIYFIKVVADADASLKNMKFVKL